VNDRTSAHHAIVWPKNIRLGHEDSQRLGEWLTANPGARAPRFAELLLAGLRTSKLDSAAQSLRNTLAELHSLAQAALALDEPAHPRPANVSAASWQDREADRLRRIREHQAQALHGVARLASRALDQIMEATQ
jgi:predicted trehalose synthase